MGSGLVAALSTRDGYEGAGFNYTLTACFAPLPVYKDSWIPGTPRGL
jgi:hypothetical protein